jgi:hypothetical protein
MSTRSFRIRGSVAASAPAFPVSTPGTLLSVERKHRITPGRARDGVTEELAVDADDVVRVELDNGFVVWSRVDALVREHGRRSLSRDGGDAWEFDMLAPASSVPKRDERGVAGLGIRVLDFFGIRSEEKAAIKLAGWFEERQLRKRAPGLYALTLDGDFALSSLKECLPPSAGGPLLIFLHGTASSTEGSFGKLWAGDNACGQDALRRLEAGYSGRAFAFEHRSLTESPVENALDLARQLPNGAELHLLSHSRGGLVGELLCLGQCADLPGKLSAANLDTLFAADRTISEQLGLRPLSPTDARERDAAYEADRKALAELLKLLAEKSIRVTRFVRAACPARGTTLASGRLDRWLSILDFLAGRALGASLFGDALEFLLAIVKERTDPRTLPGLEAMMPGSALTRLLHHGELVTAADLSVIAGDIEAGSIWQKLKLLTSDWFYGAEHDLVVNTGSMSGGLRRLSGNARYRLDRGARVDHFSYFRNAESIRWVIAGLTRDDRDDGGFLPITEAPDTAPRWRSAVERSARGTSPRPLAIVLPGTMGSRLFAGGHPIWLNYRALLRGGLGDIAIDRPGVTADGVIDDFYGSLLEFLAASHHVEIFPYDWRLSVRDAAAQLATMLERLLPEAERAGQSVHLIAHSMGGLVARAMIAGGGHGTAVWERITRLPNSRLLMLGTPNLGSYEALRWLTACNPTQARLALLDFTRNTSDLVDFVRHFPGLIELLPFAEDDPDFSDPARWKTIKDTLQASWPTAPPDALRAARDTWALLRAAPPDPGRMCYVAGCQPATIVDYQFMDYDDDSWLSGRKRLAFIASREGDGTVSWASGRLEGVSTWYLDDTAHDSLCVQQRAFPAYLELLQTGTTSRLPTSPPTTTRAGMEVTERFELLPTPPADGVPAESELFTLGFGGGLRHSPAAEPGALQTIEVSIRHGDLSYARYPVLVGHYLGDTIVSAEATLDRQLGGSLSRRLDLGLYPGRLDSNAVFFNLHDFAKPAGAIVVGLGQVGELTPGLLEAGVRSALLDYALQVAQWPSERFGAGNCPRHASVSCLFVGTGAGALTVRDSLEAILRAALAANARLQETDLCARVIIDRLEFVELFADISISAAEGLRAVLANEQIAAGVRWPNEVVESGRAGRRRVRFDEAPEWWHRLEIAEEDGNRNALRFIFTTDRARAEETLASGQLALTDAFIRAASGSPDANPEAARTLFEMLLPIRLKEAAPRQGDLVLLVDDCSARYPWELLENRWSDDGRPPAVSAGLVRQLRTQAFRARPAHAFAARALVIGNPDLLGWNAFPDLPGARNEAHKVAALLGAYDWSVQTCIDEPAENVIASLHRDAWRILHLAGHGEHEYALPPRDGQHDIKTDRERTPRTLSGMVIGRDTFLTPGDIEQIRWVPELVFINCCHLGKTRTAGDTNRGALAANLGMQFIRMGVRAVVAAGWAVDDAAALAFADAFYRRMLEGETFGEAVRAAREHVWLRFPGVNTWGAYQCYGDPGYTLHRGGQQRPPPRAKFNSSDELVVECDNLTQALKASGAVAERDEGTAGRINGLLERIPPPQRERWLKQADVAAALGFAWGEARFWHAAVEWLEKAVRSESRDCPLRAVEQLANFRARVAAEEWQTRRAKGLRATDTDLERSDALIAKAITDLELLCARAPTVERLNLLGAALKRKALVASGKRIRQEGLSACAGAYRRAFELGGSHDAYSFTNWATATLLMLQLEPKRPGDAVKAIGPEAAHLRAMLQPQETRDSDFWASASLADLDLVTLLSRELLPHPAKHPRNVPGGTARARVPAEENLVERIIEAYRRAIARGASPRERGSVIENLDFMICLLDDGPPALAETLLRIRDTL